MKTRFMIAVGGCFMHLLLATSIHAQTAPSGLEVSPPSIDFGEDAVNSDAPARTITVSNSTSSAVNLEQIIASGIDFSEKHDCGQALAPGTQCMIQVSFTPAISGPRTGSVQIMESNGNAHIIALNGVGK